MPVITKLEIQKRNKNKANLFLDGEFRCSLTAESVVRKGLKTGAELTESELDDIFFTSESEIAFGKACDNMARGMKTKKQMSDYLKQKGFDQKVVANVITKLSEYGYVDDARFAELYVQSAGGSKGERRLVAELVQKGINKEAAQNAAGQISPEETAENAGALAEKYMKSKEPTKENLVKLQRFLLSRGFDYDTVYGILHKFNAGAE